MKKTFSTLFMAAGLLATTLFTSCSDDDNNSSSGGGVTATKEYKLYNLSSGTPAEAGTVVFSQLADSTASAQVTLNSGYRQSGTTYTVNIIPSTATSVYANLTGIDGGIGTSTTSPVRRAVDNATVRYTTLTGLTGYQIRVLTGSVVQGTATIQ